MLGSEVEGVGVAEGWAFAPLAARDEAAEGEGAGGLPWWGGGASGGLLRGQVFGLVAWLDEEDWGELAGEELTKEEPGGAAGPAQAERRAEAAESVEEAVALIALLHPEEPGLGAELAALREALQERLGSQRLLSEEESARRLAAPLHGQGAIADWLEQAELQLFQLRFEEAEAYLQQALEALRGQSGGWVRDQLRLAHLLLATLRYVQATGDGPEQVIEAWLPLAKVRAGLPAGPRIPAELLPHLEEAQARAAAQAQGWLRVDCVGPCPGGLVLVDSFPLGPAGEELQLPAGSYLVWLQEGEGVEGRRSHLREVEVEAGALQTLQVHWKIERSLELGGGPAWQVEGEAEAGEAALVAAQALGLRQLWGLWRSPEMKGGLELWRWREGELSPGFRRQYKARQLERLDWSAELLALEEARLLVFREGDPAQESPPFLRKDPLLSNSSGGLESARWIGASLSLLAWGTGSWLLYDADQRSARLPGLQLASGHYESGSQAAAHEARLASIRRQQQWGGGTLAGAAVLSAGTLLLFLSAD